MATGRARRTTWFILEDGRRRHLEEGGRFHAQRAGCDFFDETYNRLTQDHGQPNVTTSSHLAIRTPLLFDRGERLEYVSNIDWPAKSSKTSPVSCWAM